MPKLYTKGWRTTVNYFTREIPRSSSFPLLRLSLCVCGALPPLSFVFISPIIAVSTTFTHQPFTTITYNKRGYSSTRLTRPEALYLLFLALIADVFLSRKSAFTPLHSAHTVQFSRLVIRFLSIFEVGHSLYSLIHPFLTPCHHCVAIRLY